MSFLKHNKDRRDPGDSQIRPIPPFSTEQKPEEKLATPILD